MGYGFNFALCSDMGRGGAVFGALPYNDGIVDVEAVADFLFGVGTGFRPPAFPRRRSVKKMGACGIVRNDENMPGGAAITTVFPQTLVQTSTPRGKSRPICRKLARDFPRIRRTSNYLILVQLIGGKFA